MEVAAAALEHLWQDLDLGPDAPLIFLGSKYHLKADHHQPRLLDMAVARGQRRKRALVGQLDRWQRLEASPYAYGIAQPLLSGPLLRANLLHGRALAAEAGGFDPPPARKRGPFFGNKGK